MKTKLFTPMTLALMALSTAPAYSIEAPADDAPPPPLAQGAAIPQPENQPQAEAAAPAANAPVAYLGVVCSNLPEMLAEHLGIPQGGGILVRSVMPDGPAAKAGILAHDVITQIAGQAIATSAELTQRITSFKPNEKIRFGVIQKGKPIEIEVTLGSRPDKLAEQQAQPLEQLDLEGIPRELADRVRDAIQGNIGKMELNEDEQNPGNPPVVPQMNDAIREMKQRMEKAIGGLNQPDNLAAPGINVQQAAAIRMMDENGSVELKSNNDSKEVTIRDHNNQITWSGPWDTEQDKSAAPDDVRKRIERLNLDPNFKGKGMRLQFGAPAEPLLPPEPLPNEMEDADAPDE